MVPTEGGIKGRKPTFEEKEPRQKSRMGCQNYKPTMMKFFRQIRYDLKEKNLPAREGTAEQAGKTRKYLKYALGEVVLVVIGILIALSLNNWNENRKNIKVEKGELNKIYKDLAIDSIQFDYYHAQFKKIEALHFQLYRIGINNEDLDSISEPALIRRSLYFKQLIGGDFKEFAHNLMNPKIREALISYTRSIADMENIYKIEILPLLSEKLKPYLAEQELYNTKNWFELKNRNFEDYSLEEVNGKNLLDKNGLITLAKTKKFQQLLFELNVKWNDFYTRLAIVIKENDSLRKLIKKELKNY